MFGVISRDGRKNHEKLQCWGSNLPRAISSAVSRNLRCDGRHKLLESVCCGLWYSMEFIWIDIVGGIRQLMTVIVLAGGRGERLGNLTQDLPKILVPFRHRPFLHEFLRQLHNQRVTKIIFSLGYRAEKVQAYGPYWHNIELQYAVEPESLGTAGALHYVLQRYPQTQPYFVMNGDILTNLSLDRLVDQQQMFGKPVMALVKQPDVSTFGQVFTNDNGEVTRFVEKGSGGEGYINAGVYLFGPTLQTLLSSTVRSLEYEVFPQISLQTVKFDHAKWVDIGTPEQLREAELGVPS